MTTQLRDYRFSPQMLETKPGPKGMKLTYVDVRNIAAVLDQLSPGWSSTTVLAHNGNEYSAVVTLTVDGISRSDVGSGDTPPDAQNQAFRRCAAQHGLGAYLWIGEDAQPHEPNPRCIELDALGTTIYGEQWPSVRRRNVERISNGATSDYTALSDDQLTRLFMGLKKLQNQRQAA